MKNLNALAISKALIIDNTRAVPENKGKKMADVPKKKPDDSLLSRFKEVSSQDSYLWELRSELQMKLRSQPL